MSCMHHLTRQSDVLLHLSSSIQWVVSTIQMPPAEIISRFILACSGPRV